MNDIHAGWPSDMKKTKPRAYVRAVLHAAQKPLSATEIYVQIEKMGDTVSLSTVYRILETLVKKGLVVKTTIMDNDMAIFALRQKQHTHYAVCVSCHKVIAMDNCPLETFLPQLEDSEFHVMGHKVELYGYCKACDTAI